MSNRENNNEVNATNDTPATLQDMGGGIFRFSGTVEEVTAAIQKMFKGGRNGLGAEIKPTIWGLKINGVDAPPDVCRALEDACTHKR